MIIQDLNGSIAKYEKVKHFVRVNIQWTNVKCVGCVDCVLINCKHVSFKSTFPTGKNNIALTLYQLFPILSDPVWIMFEIIHCIDISF